MAQHLLGIVLLVPEPWATEIDGVRRALGDEALDRIPPHVTLVPPIHVREEHLAEAFDVVHAASAGCPELDLRLGPVTTFAPVNPVAYLDVAAEPGAMADLIGLKDRLHTGLEGARTRHQGAAAGHNDGTVLSGRLADRLGSMARPADFAFVPHVTVARELAADRIEAAVHALADYRAEVRVERVHVLAWQPDRTWIPVADAPLGVR